ncbi:MAG: TIGR02117 family protein [Bacteroidales bacterium]
MEIIKKIGIILFKVFFSILLIICLYFLIASITTIVPVNKNFVEIKNGTAIYVSSNGVHTDIIVPVESECMNWKSFLKLKTDYKFIAFGWGDKEFYMNTPTWADLKIKTALKAAFLFDESVLQVRGIDYKPKESKNTIRIFLSDKQLNELNNYIYTSFKINDLTEPVEIKISESSYHYFEAEKRYSVFFTCNNWTSKGLKLAGIKNSLWAPFDWSVLFYLRRLQ